MKSANAAEIQINPPRQTWTRVLILLVALTLPAHALATLLSLTDPAGDATGDGTLVAPSAEAFDHASFDARRVAVSDAETLTLRLELATPISSPADQAGPQAITELYLDSEPGGAKVLLPGSDMRLGSGGWEVAFQIIGERLRVFRLDAQGNPVEATDALGARLVREGNTLLITTSLETPERFSLYGLVGSYDPFSETGWRRVSLEPSPWHFSSPTQTRPVIDVIADDAGLQIRAVERGVLPEIRASFQQRRWLLLASAGVAVALGGLALRLFAPKEVAPNTDDESAQSATPTEVVHKNEEVDKTNSVPVISYGAHEAGERAQILRTIDFETLQKGEWLEPVNGDVDLTLNPAPESSEADTTSAEEKPNETAPPGERHKKRSEDAFDAFIRKLGN